MRRLVCLFFLGALAWSATAHAQGAAGPGRIEIVDVSGVIDGNVEKAVGAGLTGAEREGAAVVILRIDSPGSVGAGRAERIAARIRDANVPVVTWVGPSGAHARNGAELVWLAGHVRTMSPAGTIGSLDTLDLRKKRTDGAQLQRLIVEFAAVPRSVNLLDADQAKRLPFVDALSPGLADLISKVKGHTITVRSGAIAVNVDASTSPIRFHKLDLFGRLLHAAAQPSITYLLVLLGLVGIVFEAFHPSTGPAGAAGLLAMALAVYGIVVLGGSWIGFGLIVAGVGGFAIDLRFASLGVPTFAGLAGVTAGSLLLFAGPWLRVPVALLVFGIVAMTAFMVGAMTRVLRDLRLVRSGQLQVRDAHEHIASDNSQGGSHAP